MYILIIIYIIILYIIIIYNYNTYSMNYIACRIVDNNEEDTGIMNVIFDFFMFMYWCCRASVITVLLDC